MIRCVVTRDGGRVSPVLPDENAAFGWLLQHQPQSVEYAIRYGGFEIRRLPDLDARDLDILTRRQEGLDRRQGARVGDFVRMPDGTLRRITHCWNWPEGKESVQLDSPGGGGSY